MEEKVEKPRFFCKRKQQMVRNNLCHYDGYYHRLDFCNVGGKSYTNFRPENLHCYVVDSELHRCGSSCNRIDRTRKVAFANEA